MYSITNYVSFYKIKDYNLSFCTILFVTFSSNLKLVFVNPICGWELSFLWKSEPTVTNRLLFLAKAFHLFVSSIIFPSLVTNK